MKKLAILTLTFLALTGSAYAVNIGDLENARGYSYMYRMNGQQYYADNRVIVRAGEGNNYEIIAKTYSHQGAVNDTLRMYKNDDIRMYNFNCITDTIVEVITTCNTYTLLTVHLL